MLLNSLRSAFSKQQRSQKRCFFIFCRSPPAHGLSKLQSNNYQQNQQVQKIKNLPSNLLRYSFSTNDNNNNNSSNRTSKSIIEVDLEIEQLFKQFMHDLELGKNDEGIPHLIKAVELAEANNIDSQRNSLIIGMMLRKNNKFKEAIEFSIPRKSTIVGQKNSNRYFLVEYVFIVGQSLMHLGQTQRAIEVLKEVLGERITPSNIAYLPMSIRLLGEAYVGLDMLIESTEVFEKGVEMYAELSSKQLLDENSRQQYSYFLSLCVGGLIMQADFERAEMWNEKARELWKDTEAQGIFEEKSHLDSIMNQAFLNMQKSKFDESMKDLHFLEKTFLRFIVEKNPEEHIPAYFMTLHLQVTCYAINRSVDPIIDVYPVIADVLKKGRVYSTHPAFENFENQIQKTKSEFGL